MERRDFLKKLIGLFSLTAVVSFLYPLLKFLSPKTVAARPKKLEIERKKVPPGTAYKGSINNKPIIVVHDPVKGIIALSRECTHLGCLVDYDRSVNRLICPCHGANFTVDGRVISGPPPRPLERLPVNVVGNKIVVG